MAHLIWFVGCNWQFMQSLLHVLLCQRRTEREFSAERWPRAFPARANDSFAALSHALLLFRVDPSSVRGKSHFSPPAAARHSAALQAKVESSRDFVSSLLPYSFFFFSQSINAIKSFFQLLVLRPSAKEITDVTEFHRAGCKTSDVREWANRPNDGVETTLPADKWNCFVCQCERTESSPPLDVWCHILFRKYLQFVVTVGENENWQHISIRA